MSARPSNPRQPQIPALPTGGGAIQGQGMQWGPVGAKGEACLDLPLPVSPGRDFAPSLALSYRSSQGNGPFGLGWAVPVATISRNTRKGVPNYTQDDPFISPHGLDLVPERDSRGAIQASTCTQYEGVLLAGAHRVVRYFPVIEARFDRIEHWSTASDSAGFWLVQGADGCVHLFGKTAAARCANPDHPEQVAQWLLQESLSPLGEHIYYHYKQEDQCPPSPRDYRAQRYLARVCYGNRLHRKQLALWNSAILDEKQWHFELLFDYGERDTGLTQAPTYTEQYRWPQRQDPFSSYAYGFELGTQRLCQQILMFHYFPDEPGMGAEPVLTRRLVLEYSTSAAVGSCLRALHTLAYDAQGEAHPWPPLELAYSTFKPVMDSAHYQAFESLAGLDDGHHYQLVDLYNDGLPGLLHRSDKSWSYREPQRGKAGADEVSYGPWTELPRIPLSDSTQPTRQALADLNGDGRLEWVVAQPGLSGFFSLDAHRQWSGFTPFSALPQEFFHPQGQLADLVGDGRYDLVMIGSHSVRLYANRQDEGYAPANEVAHASDDALPSISNTAAELVGFCDLLGSGQQHLVRIRHNQIKCWPNLGHGRFAKGFVFATLAFDYSAFDAANIRLADLDGSGAVDLLYLEPERVLIYMNQKGAGLAPTPLTLPWPAQVRHDSTCQVSLADLQGLGCSSLILSVPHMAHRHWRYDFVSQKPYLLTTMVNNMGASTQVSYRSSAQEWLDEKQLTASGSGLPFAVQVVTQQRQRDLVSGDVVSRHYRYRESCYDAVERQFIGFGLLIETDTQPTAAQDSASLLTKRWFHTLSAAREPYYRGDPQAPRLGSTLLTTLETGQTLDTPMPLSSAPTQHALKRALSGSLLREERYAAADEPHTAVPYSVQQQRYLVRALRLSRKAGEPAVLLPLLLESITCHYEREPDDPRCQHTLNLRWDRYGNLEHSVVVDYARRKTATAPPPTGNPHQQQWWRDAHDAAQQAWYVNETRADFIHLDAPQRWQLHLPYRQRHNVWVLAKHALSSSQISYEHVIADNRQNPLGPYARRQLSGLWVHHYCRADCASPLPTGTATLPALLAYLEVAELDEQALQAYQQADTPQFDIHQALTERHFQRLPPALNTLPGQHEVMDLWSVIQGHTRYGQAAEFYRPRRYQASLSHGVTQTEYDAYHLQVIKVRTADGCTTHARYDYRLGVPVTVTDAQCTVQYAHYDAHGYLIASGLGGKEHDNPAGEENRQAYIRGPDATPTQALANPQAALLKAQVACFHDAFSWMGRVALASVQPQWVQSGYLLPGGYIRASALTRVNRQPQLQALKALIQAARREPVHVAVLQAERLPGTPGHAEGNIRIALAYTDGLGRVRQTQEKTQPGPAFKVQDTGVLSVDIEQKPLEVQAPDRWRISGRIEYDNKGLVARTWRPYFANRAGYVRDEALKTLSARDQHIHDPLGRPVGVLTANGNTRRQTYWAWYSVSEDENDTQTSDSAG